MTLIERLAREGRVAVNAVYDADPAKRDAAARRLDLSPDVPSDLAVCEHDDVDAVLVLVLTSMPEHARLARAALEAGKHVLVEKPMATDLRDGEALLEAAETAPGVLVCAPHILLSPTYRAMHARCERGRDRRPAVGPRALRLGRAVVGPLVLRARRGRAVRPRDLQRHEPVRLLRPGPPRDRDARGRDP